MLNHPFLKSTTVPKIKMKNPSTLQEALFLIRAGHKVPHKYQETLIKTLFRCESESEEGQEGGNNTYTALYKKHGNYGM